MAYVPPGTDNPENKPTQQQQQQQQQGSDPKADPWYAAAVKAAAERKVQPPAGADYDTWVVQWFRAGVQAGDADLMKRAGITQKSEGGGENDLIADWENAAPSKEWLGKRAPTPGELRKYARDNGQSEDYARFPDRVLAKWIKDKWQVKEGYFVNDFGDRVEKPTEAGPNSIKAGYATGEKSSGMKGGGGGGGGTDTTTAEEDPLKNELLKLWMGDAGIFSGLAGKDQQEVASVLPKGALWWGEKSVAPAPEASAAAKPTPTFFGASNSGGGTLPSLGEPATNPAGPSANFVKIPTTTTTTPSIQNSLTKFSINKTESNPLVDALMRAANPKRVLQ